MVPKLLTHHQKSLIALSPGSFLPEKSSSAASLTSPVGRLRWV
jgi:hypothetical protein